jgi:flagellar motility protein MotE (MotC chaperone)
MIDISLSDQDPLKIPAMMSSETAPRRETAPRPVNSPLKRPSTRTPTGTLPTKRLVQAVMLGASALLILRLITMASDNVEPRFATPPPPGMAEMHLPQFGRAIAYARSGPELKVDAIVTGSVVATPTPPPAAAPPAAAPPASAPRPLVAEETPVSPSERAILERLGERREKLQQRDDELQTRERLLESIEQRLEGKIGELKNLEKGMTTTPEAKASAESQQLKNLVLMYETMKPKDAARVFDKLSLDVLVPVVLQMNPRKMSEVLANMSSDAAQNLTVALATRSKPMPTAAASSPLPSTELQSLQP